MNSKEALKAWGRERSVAMNFLHKNMNVLKLPSSACLTIIVCCLTGCVIQPIQQNQSLSLRKGYGVAAVQFDTREAQPKILFDSADENGPQLQIENIPIGQSLYLLEVPAGRYCMAEYFYVGQRIFPHDMGCFSVTEGKIGFSGFLNPKVVDGEIFVEQAFREDDAENQLKQEYPNIAEQYFVTPSPGEWVTTWVDRKYGHKTKIYVHNNLTAPAMITTLRLYDCKNLMQECGVYHVNVDLAPHETKTIMEIEAADHTAAYSYAYDLN